MVILWRVPNKYARECYYNIILYIITSKLHIFFCTYMVGTYCCFKHFIKYRTVNRAYLYDIPRCIDNNMTYYDS